MRTFIIISFLISFSFLNLCAQGTLNSKEIFEMRPVVHAHHSKKIYRNAKNNSNELELIFSGLFLFYKNFISSQDSQSCSFTPSCSEFGMEAVKKQGVFFGVLNTLDRLTRCNSFSPEKYERDPITSLLFDPL
jgi:uncharacterized protein